MNARLLLAEGCAETHYSEELKCGEWSPGSEADGERRTGASLTHTAHSLSVGTSVLAGVDGSHSDSGKLGTCLALTHKMGTCSP